MATVNNNTFYPCWQQRRFTVIKVPYIFIYISQLLARHLQIFLNKYLIHIEIESEAVSNQRCPSDLRVVETQIFTFIERAGFNAQAHTTIVSAVTATGARALTYHKTAMTESSVICWIRFCDRLLCPWYQWTSGRTIFVDSEWLYYVINVSFLIP